MVHSSVSWKSVFPLSSAFMSANPHYIAQVTVMDGHSNARFLFPCCRSLFQVPRAWKCTIRIGNV